MKVTKIASARIKSSYYRLIDHGVKKYEVRTEPLEGLNAFYFLDDKTGELLGIRSIEKVFSFNRSEDELVLNLSAICPDDFYRLFPPLSDGGPDRLWVAKLGPSIELGALLKSE